MTAAAPVAQAGYPCATPRGEINSDDAVFRFNPGLDKTEPGLPPLRSDVSLFHEMVHARDVVEGRWDKDPILPSDVPLASDAERRGVLHDASSTDDAGDFVPREEHQATGIGKYHGTALSENAYREERAEIGEKAGAVPGDLNMPQRTSYVPFLDLDSLGTARGTGKED